MKSNSSFFRICLLSVIVMLVGTSRYAEAHTVDLAYRCEEDGSVTFFAATDHAEIEENSGDLLLARVGGDGGTAHAFTGLIPVLPDDVDDQWGFPEGLSDLDVVWQTVNLLHFEGGDYYITTRDLENDVAMLNDFWRDVTIDCDSMVVRVKIEIEPGEASHTIDISSKDKDKDKDKTKGKAKGKGKEKSKGKAKRQGKGPGKAKGQAKSKGKPHAKSKGKAKGHEIKQSKGKGKAKGKGGDSGTAQGASSSPNDLLTVVVFSGPGFDATQINMKTGELGDEGLDGVATPLLGTIEDVDGDGLDDLVLHFSLSELLSEKAVDKWTVELRLTGFTHDGRLIFGYDSI